MLGGVVFSTLRTFLAWQRRHRALQPATIERVIWIGSYAKLRTLLMSWNYSVSHLSERSLSPNILKTYFHNCWLCSRFSLSIWDTLSSIWLQWCCSRKLRVSSDWPEFARMLSKAYTKISASYLHYLSQINILTFDSIFSIVGVTSRLS